MIRLERNPFAERVLRGSIIRIHSRVANSKGIYIKYYLLALDGTLVMAK